jgi:hypothetical protein
MTESTEGAALAAGASGRFGFGSFFVGKSHGIFGEGIITCPGAEAEPPEGVVVDGGSTGAGP